MPTPHNPPAAVRRALRKLGADIRDARRRRRLPMAVVAGRAFTSRSTLQRVEAEGYFDALVRMFGQALQAIDALPEDRRPALIARLDAVRRISHNFGYRVGGDMDELLAEHRDAGGGDAGR
jgi:hypothetical protein